MDACAARWPSLSSPSSSSSCSRASSPKGQGMASGAEQHGILAQFWNPCTGDTPMGRHMDYLQFPVSYRYLFYKWKRLGEPRLQMLRTPLNLQLGYPQRHSINLQEISEAQEGRIIEALQTTLASGFTLSRPNLFVGFASHLDIYCAVHAELLGIESGDTSIEAQAKTYEATWRNLLEAFELDRSVCLARQKHDCIGYLIWGEMYFWPLLEIRRRFEAYRRRSSSANLSTSGEVGSSSIGLYSPVLSNGTFACSSSMPSMSPHGRCHSLSQIVAGPMPLISSTSSMGTLTPSSNSEVRPFTPISHGGLSHDFLAHTPSSSYAPRSMSRSSPSFVPEKDVHLLDDKAWSDALALLQTLKDADEQAPSTQNRIRSGYAVESPTDMSFSPTSPPFDGQTDYVRSDAEQSATASVAAARPPLQRRYHSVLEEAANFLTATSKVFDWSTSYDGRS